jgi:hypothetical protein
MHDVSFERRALAHAAAGMAYPVTPDLRARVRASIARDDALSDERGPSSVRRYAFAAGVVGAVSVAAVLALPASRSAVADFFGIEGERIERLPTPPPGTTATPLPTATGIEQLATPVALEAAAARAGFEPALVRGDAPAAAYVLDYGGPVVVLQYERYDLWQSRAMGLFEKGLPAEALLREFTIDGDPAAWISGGHHIVRYIDASGAEVAGSQRTVARNTLVWSTAASHYRIETDLSQEEAVAIAETLP